MTVSWYDMIRSKETVEIQSRKSDSENMRRKKNRIPNEVINARKLARKTARKAGRQAYNIAGEFKEFISRGNVTAMAIGVVVGTSFTAIANSLANNVITPLIGVLMGGIDVSAKSFTVHSPFFEDYSVTINYGHFFQSVINFFIIAVSVFFMVKLLNTVSRNNKQEEESQDDIQIALLTEIRDALCQNNPDTPDYKQLTLNDTDSDENDNKFADGGGL